MPATQLDLAPISITPEQLQQRLSNLEQITYGIASCALELSRITYALASATKETQHLERIKVLGIELKDYVAMLPDHFG